MRFDLSDISKYRSSIMGFAMIWVVLYHYQIEGVLRYPFGFGFTGVDLFMLCSGLGLFYSYDKNPDTFRFYRKRFLRIVPTYFLVGLIVGAINGNFSFTEYLWKFSTLGFWTDGTYYDWFIPGIILLYLLYPFIHNTLFKDGVLEKQLILLILVVFSFFIVYTTFVDQSIMDVNHFLLLYRIPVFLLGVIVAYGIKVVKGTRCFIILSFVLFPLSCIYFLYAIMPVTTIHIRYLSTVFMVPLLVIGLCLFFKHIIVRYLSIMGGGRKSLFRDLLVAHGCCKSF